MPRLRPPRKDTLACALLCFCCALLSLGFFMLQDGGALTLREDFDFQQLPFIMGLHNQIARGGLAGWCWNLDLGASAIQGFGFYELGSPFFWASMLFPSAAFPYVAGWLYILKYTVAGVTAHLFIRRFVKSPRAATAGALLYAFAGFSSTNLLFFHFHDVVAFFPLLLIGFERLMADKRDFWPFVLAVCINALTNYFFFVQSVVFLLLYFGFRFGPELFGSGIGVLARAIGRCLMWGVLGVAMAGILIVPSFVYMLSNPRAGGLQLQAAIWDPWQFLFQIQGFLLPADLMHDHNAVIDQQWTSTSCWLPLVGPSLALAYLGGKRDWLSRLIIALLVICVSPFLTSAFTLFINVYQRWWYTLVLMGALASAQVIDDPDTYEVGRACAVSAGIVALFVAVVLVGSQVLGTISLFHLDRFLLHVGISLAGIGLTYLLMRKGSADKVGAVQARLGEKGALIACIALFAVGTTALMVGMLRQNLLVGELLDNISVEEQQAGTLNELALGSKLRMLDPQYRYATGDNRLTLPGEAAGVSSFSSTVSSASGQFDELFDCRATSVWHLNKSTVPGLVELLGGRYHVTAFPGTATIADQHEVGGTTYFVVEKDACPLGVLYDQYTLCDDVKELPLKQRGLALLQAPVVVQEDQAKLEGFATQMAADDLDLTKSVSDLVNAASAHAVNDFWRNDYGFGFTTDADAASLAYLAIPRDSGWTAYVDGAEATVVDSAGMMVLPLTAGAHTVEFCYKTPGLLVGVAVSAGAWLVFAATLIVERLRKR